MGSRVTGSGDTISRALRRLRADTRGSAARPSRNEGLQTDRDGSRTVKRGGSNALRLAGVLLVVLVVGATAVWVRRQQVLLSGGFSAIGGYDDGVYFSAAQALVHGRLPYRDFLFLQPPGILIVLAPFAALAEQIGDGQAFTVARYAFVGLGGLNAVLIVLILTRLGLPATLVGGTVYAVFAPAAYAERSTLLEPLGTLGVLLALLILARDGPAARAVGRLRTAWPVLAGLALAGAIGAKGWYLLPAAIIVLSRPRRALPIVAGMLLGGIALFGPFLVAGGGAMLREVVIDQLGRPRIVTDTVQKRLSGLLGVHTRPGTIPPQAAFWTIDTQILVFGVAALALAALALTVRGARVWVMLLAAGTAVVVVVTPTFYLHYSALTSPPLALVVGAGVHRLVAPLRRPGRRWQVVRGAAGLAAALGALLVLHQPTYAVGAGRAIPVERLRAAAAQVPGCILSDDPSMLIEMNVVSRDLALGCTFRPDVTGYTYDADAVPGPPVRQTNERWQRDLAAYLATGDAFILVRGATGIDDATHAQLVRGPVLARVDQYFLHGRSMHGRGSHGTDVPRMGPRAGSPSERGGSAPHATLMADRAD